MNNPAGRFAKQFCVHVAQALFGKVSNTLWPKPPGVEKLKESQSSGSGGFLRLESGLGFISFVFEFSCESVY